MKCKKQMIQTSLLAFGLSMGVGLTGAPSALAAPPSVTKFESKYTNAEVKTAEEQYMNIHKQWELTSLNFFKEATFLSPFFTYFYELNDICDDWRTNLQEKDVQAIKESNEFKMIEMFKKIESIVNENKEKKYELDSHFNEEEIKLYDVYITFEFVNNKSISYNFNKGTVRKDDRDKGTVKEYKIGEQYIENIVLDKGTVEEYELDEKAVEAFKLYKAFNRHEIYENEEEHKLDKGTVDKIKNVREVTTLEAAKSFKDATEKMRQARGKFVNKLKNTKELKGYVDKLNSEINVLEEKVNKYSGGAMNVAIEHEKTTEKLILQEKQEMKRLLEQNK